MIFFTVEDLNNSFLTAKKSLRRNFYRQFNSNKLLSQKYINRYDVNTTSAKPNTNITQKIQKAPKKIDTFLSTQENFFTRIKFTLKCDVYSEGWIFFRGVSRISYCARLSMPVGKGLRS